MAEPLNSRVVPTRLSLDALPALISPGKLVYVPGSSGAPVPFVQALLKDPERTRGLRMLTTYVPGINRLDLSGMHSTGRVSGLFMQPSLGQAQREGRYEALPMSYAGFVQHLVEQVDIDLCVLQVAPPDSAGLCSLGPAVEFSPVALRKSRRVVGIINRQTPRLAGAVSVPYERFDYVCDVDVPLPEYHAPTDVGTEAIARHVAPLIGDGAVVQTGLGKVPTALAQLLCDRRGLRLHSGMLSDGILDLAAAGALDMDFQHTTCVLVGSPRLYREAPEMPNLRILSCEQTHDPRLLASYKRFVAVNTALEVDLFGQGNLEHAGGAAISGPGGAPDFARAGRLSSGGASIVALHALHKHGSRIVSRLKPPAVASISRVDVDYVVTEHGVARLRGACVHARAEALIEVAAPEARAELIDAWRDIARQL